MKRFFTWAVCLFCCLGCYHVSQLEGDTSDTSSDSVTGAAVSSSSPETALSSDSHVYDIDSFDSADSTILDTETATAISGPDTHSDSAIWGTDSEEADTLFTVREPHFCDDLGWDACMDAEDECGRMYLEAVHFIDPVGVSASCETESLFYGCTPWKYCYEDIFLAFDPDGRCWLMPTGCLPNEPGWIPAVADERCSEPVWVHSCIE